MYDSRHSSGSGQGFFMLMMALFVVATCIAGVRNERASQDETPAPETPAPETPAAETSPSCECAR